MEISNGSVVNSEYRTQMELLQKKSLADLKEMAKELGVPTSSKLKRKADWVNAIIEHCSTSEFEAEEPTCKEFEIVSSDLKSETEVSHHPTIRHQPQKMVRKITQSNSSGFAQKRQYQSGYNNPTGNYNRQPNYQNNNYPNQTDYQRNNPTNSAYPNYNQNGGSYQAGLNQQSTYNSQRQQYDRNNYNQNNFVNYQQHKKVYPSQSNDGYRQQLPNSYSNNTPQYPQQNEQQVYPYQQNVPQYRQDERYGYRNADENIPHTNDFNCNHNQPVESVMEEPETVNCEAVLEIMPDGYGFLRSNNYLSGNADVYVSNQQVRRNKLRTGDYIVGKTRHAQSGEKYPPLLYISTINGDSPEIAMQRKHFEDLIPIYPNERLTLEHADEKNLSIRLIDLFSPIGKGQRGLIVSQPKAGKTTLLKQIANGITENYPDVHLIVLLIDERPEEVTDIKRSIKSKNADKCEVLYSTFDELPDHHTRVAEMVMERSMRLVEQGKDVVVLMDSITRLARAYNITLPSTGKTLSGGMDPSALFKPKRFFGAARNIEGGGSLTIIATALVETGSRMDDMVYEEFKGTGNMEIHLDRKLSEKRIFPAIDIYKSGTRHDDLLLSEEEFDCIQSLRRIFSNSNTAEVTEQVIEMLAKSTGNTQFVGMLKAWFSKQEKDGYSNKS